MASTKLIRRALAAILTIGVFATIMLVTGLVTGPAEAQRGARDYYYDRYETGRRGRGYEGFRYPGSYCSYRRYPRRVCTYDKRGREVCKTKGWTVEQFCD